MVDKISELEERRSVTIEGRVLEVGEVKDVQTRYGLRKLGEAVVGDDTGRVKVTLWDDKAGTLKKGEVIRIRNGWTTSFRGELKVNVNRRSEIERLNDWEAPQEEEIPNFTPRTTNRRYYRRHSRRGFQERH